MGQQQRAHAVGGQGAAQSYPVFRPTRPGTEDTAPFAAGNLGPDCGDAALGCDHVACTSFLSKLWTSVWRAKKFLAKPEKKVLAKKFPSFTKPPALK